MVPIRRSACLLILVVICGCDSGPPLGVVTGKVTVNCAVPQNRITVTFMPTEGGRSSSAITDSEGNYELIYIDRSGALIGSHKVALQTNREASDVGTEVSSDSEDYANQGALSNYSTGETQWKDPIPAKYNSATELSAKVESGTNVIDFDIQR